MDIRRATLSTCTEATGTVVVIDVLRAFTTAAFAFDAGAQAITVLADVENAFALHEEHPDWLIAGEEGGVRVPGFDFGNSPTAFLDQDLTGRHLIQRTSSGTQGLIRSHRAEHLLAASLCCARASVDYISRFEPDRVTMVITGSHPDGLADEDQACADYMEALFMGESPDREHIIERVRNSRAAQKFRDPKASGFSPSDLEYAVDVDRFSFAMAVQHQGNRGLMRPVQPG